MEPPAVAVTRTEYVPVFVFDATASRRDADPGAETGAPVQVLDIPVGRADVESPTLPVKPPTDPTETVEVADWPRLIDSDVGDTETEKSGGAVTERMADTDRVNPPPPDAVIVKG